MKRTLCAPYLLKSVVVACLALIATSAAAHKASDSFIYLDKDNSELRLDIALRDLAVALPMDSNRDQALTGAELRSAKADITRWVEAGVSLSSVSGTCQLRGRDWGLSSHSDGAYAAAVYGVECPNGEHPETMDYRLLFEHDPLHRGLLSVTQGDAEGLHVFSPDNPSVTFNESAGAFNLLGTFIYEGIIHLLIGLDHLLFLLVLMLPATLRNKDERGDSGVKQRIWQLTGIVTAFTVAHSITLALAALKWFTLPIAWVETVIALSIALAALNVAWPILGRKTWKLAFAFGLVHGFGFASVLGDLTDGLEQTALALAGFNIGVELGQVALLLLVFPLLYAWGKTGLYGRAIVPAVLVATGTLSLYWVAERAAAI